MKNEFDYHIATSQSWQLKIYQNITNHTVKFRKFLKYEKNDVTSPIASPIFQ